MDTRDTKPQTQNGAAILSAVNYEAEPHDNFSREMPINTWHKRLVRELWMSHKQQ